MSDDLLVAAAVQRVQLLLQQLGNVVYVVCAAQCGTHDVALWSFVDWKWKDIIRVNDQMTYENFCRVRRITGTGRSSLDWESILNHQKPHRATVQTQMTHYAVTHIVSEKISNSLRQ